MKAGKIIMVSVVGTSLVASEVKCEFLFLSPRLNTLQSFEEPSQLFEQPHIHSDLEAPYMEINPSVASASGANTMYIVMNLKSKCGSRFEAHVKARAGTGAMSIATCPDCGDSMNIPDVLVRPLIRLPQRPRTTAVESPLEHR